jgi:hypothetical protein
MNATRGVERCTLVWPTEEYLPSYVDALRRGWSPDNLRPEAAREELDDRWSSCFRT